MSDTTTDPGAIPTDTPVDTPTIIDTPAPAPTPTDTPVNEAVPTTVVVDPATIITTPTDNLATLLTTAPFVAPTVASTFITGGISISNTSFSTSIRPTSSSNGSPVNGPPPFVTAGGRSPFANGQGPPFFNNDDDDSEGLSGGAKAGIGIGVVALVFGIVGIALFFWRKKKKENDNRWSVGPSDGPAEQLPSYTESNAQRHPPPPGAAMEMKPKSAMKKVAPAPLVLDLHNSGSSTPTNYPTSTERRRSYAMEGTQEPLVLSIWEPANKSANSSAANSPVLGPAPPPKVHRKSNAGSSRPRRKSNLAPVSEEEGEASGMRPPLPNNDSGSSQSPPQTPRTPRSAAFHALTGGPNSGQNSPMNSSFTLDPVPPLPSNVSPVSSKFSDKDVKHVR